jgi:hypothetical protein
VGILRDLLVMAPVELGSAAGRDAQRGRAHSRARTRVGSVDDDEEGGGSW